VVDDVGRVRVGLLEALRPQDKFVKGELRLVQADDPDGPPEQEPSLLDPRLALFGLVLVWHLVDLHLKKRIEVS